jgi:S1-C subfamily serine protease
MSHFWRHFISNGDPASQDAYLGVYGRRVRMPRTGVEVRRVVPGSPAERAGILEGDILLVLAGRPTRGVDELHDFLAELPAEVPLPVRFLRRGRCLERWVSLSRE